MAIVVATLVIGELTYSNFSPYSNTSNTYFENLQVLTFQTLSLFWVW